MTVISQKNCNGHGFFPLTQRIFSVKKPYNTCVRGAKHKIFCRIAYHALDQRLDIMDPPKLPRLRDFWETVVNNTEVLESALMLAPTTLEMGLTPLQLLHLDSQDSLQAKIADLVATRDASDRYSSIQIVSSDELNFLLNTFARSEKAHNKIFKLRELLNSECLKTI